MIGVGRDPGRMAAAESEIRAVSISGDVDLIPANLALLSNATCVAEAIGALTGRVDVLINNAGSMAKKKVIAAEGYEENFASNHLAPFLLTMRLLPLLRHAAENGPKGSVRILNTASDASEMIPGLDWNDIQSLDNFHPGLAYCRAKLANILFARGLARRLAGDGVAAHAMHPGAVDSNFITHADEQSQATMLSYDRLTPEQRADTLIWLATAEDVGVATGAPTELFPRAVGRADSGAPLPWAGHSTCEIAEISGRYRELLRRSN